MPGAPSQLNDSLLPQWPFGQKGAPLWHMDGPIDRLIRLCGRYDRVCLGWTGKTVGSADYHARMEEVARALGNRWPVLHMMRGTAEWICGPGSDGHEYLVHTMSPRFLCLVLTEDEYGVFAHQTDGDCEADGMWLCGFHWIDRRPDDLAMWMERAADALEALV